MGAHRVIHDIIPMNLTIAALRRLNLEIVDHGVTSQQISEWSQSTWFPHLRADPTIVALQHFAHRILAPDASDTWCEPQILMRYPNASEHVWTPVPHIDELPLWAQPGQRYRYIVGIPLTPSRVDDGCLHVWRDGVPVPVELDVGDMLVMDSDTPHSGTKNRGAAIRSIVYFRLLTSASSDTT